MNWRLETYDDLPSTSDLCTTRAKAGEPEGLAVLAHSQTAGRGSRGRNWVSAPGNLYLSVLLRPDLPAAGSGVFPFLAGLAVAEAIDPHLPGEKPVLKWPNDILLGGAKLAGILIDAAPVQNRLDWLVVGIGVNLRHAPDVAGRRTTTIAAHGPAPAPQAAAHAVLNHLAYWLDVFSTEGPAAIHTAWLARAHPVGTPLTVSTPHDTTHGSFAGLSPTGELLLRIETRIETFSTGDILLGGRG